MPAYSSVAACALHEGAYGFHWNTHRRDLGLGRAPPREAAAPAREAGAFLQRRMPDGAGISIGGGGVACTFSAAVAASGPGGTNTSCMHFASRSGPTLW